MFLFKKSACQTTNHGSVWNKGLYCISLWTISKSLANPWHINWHGEVLTILREPSQEGTLREKDVGKKTWVQLHTLPLQAECPQRTSLTWRAEFLNVQLKSLECVIKCTRGLQNHHLRVTSSLRFNRLPSDIYTNLSLRPPATGFIVPTCRRR